MRTIVKFGQMHAAYIDDGQGRRIALKPGPTNAEIAPVILGRVADWPTRSNNHQRDAAGAAIYAAYVAGLPLLEAQS